MSGKGKRNRRDRGTKFDGKRIDYVCLACDVFKYLALKFGVEDNCLAAWVGSANNYGGSDVLESISRAVLVNQFTFRSEWYPPFKRFFQRNGLDSPELACQLLEKTMASAISHEGAETFEVVEKTLSLTCELIIFLDAVLKGLYLKQLAECWFECGFRKLKKKFEREGGLSLLYERGRLHIFEFPELFMDLCIKHHYPDYKKSAVDKNCIYKYINSALVYKENNPVYEFTRQTSIPSQENVPRIVIEPPLTSKRNEASGVSLPQNPGLGVPNPHEIPAAADAEPSQNLSETSSQELSRRAKRPSYSERKRNRKTSNTSSVVQRLGQLSLDSSGTKQSREENPSVSIGTVATPSYEHLGARPKNPVRNTGTDGSSLYPSVVQRLGQLSLDSSGTK